MLLYTGFTRAGAERARRAAGGGGAAGRAAGRRIACAHRGGAQGAPARPLLAPPPIARQETVLTRARWERKRTSMILSSWQAAGEQLKAWSEQKAKTIVTHLPPPMKKKALSAVLKHQQKRDAKKQKVRG